jgi:hypothetical protein
VAHTRTKGTLVTKLSFLVDAMSSAPEQGSHSPDESDRAGDAVVHGSAGHSADEVRKVWEKKAIDDFEGVEETRVTPAGRNVTGKHRRDPVSTRRDEALTAVARGRDRGNGSFGRRRSCVVVEHNVKCAADR